LNGTFLAICPLIASSLAFAQPPAPGHGQIDTSPALFTVMAAINAAGYDADLGSSRNSPLRETVREWVLAKKPECLDDLKQFYAVHRKKNWTAELSQYISFALSVKGPPDFGFSVEETDLPPDVLPMQGLNELLARFYREADIASIWRQSQPLYDRAIAAYQPGIVRAVTQVNAYVRNIASGYLGRRFQIYVDLLAAPDQVQSRSYGDDYFVVVTPSAEPQIDAVRHAYLGYMLDPLSLKYAEVLAKYRSLGDFAAGAPALGQIYKDDFSLLSTECLIRAVESRLARSGQARQAIVDQAVREGFVLTPAFADGLVGYEKQQQALRLYFPDMVSAIDLRKEALRLENVKFAEAPKTLATPEPGDAPKPALTPAEEAFEQAESAYLDRKLELAREGYTHVLSLTDSKPLQAKAYYGLARIAALERNPELSVQLFKKTLETGGDPDTRCWSLVYLGRIADAEGDRDNATANYKAALAVAGATAAARKAAQSGLEQSFKKPE
jgi:tetratricopeptide (TPR) repeat protein